MRRYLQLLPHLLQMSLFQKQFFLRVNITNIYNDSIQGIANFLIWY